MKAYLAGKITGNENYRSDFENAERMAKEKGFNVILNPAILPEGMRTEDYMKICFAMIDVAEVVVFLPNWEQSWGAKVEHDYCQYISKQTFYL